MQPSLFDQIRAGAAEVMRRAKHVRLAPPDVIRRYALGLPLEKLAKPTIDPASHYIDALRPEITAAFFVTLDTINFGSGYFPNLRKRPGKSGYYTVATCLMEEFQRRGGPIGAPELCNLTADRCRQMFQQSPDDGPIDELMGLFAQALNDLGRLLLNDFGGEAANLIRSCDHSAERLARTLSRMPFFRDVQRYAPDLEVPFFKRAQLTAADLSIAMNGRGLGEFRDLDRLTIFADNLVPHVLRVDGVLQYDPALAARIDSEQLIGPNSPEEIELRAGAVHVCELIVSELLAAGRSVTAAQVDYLLWHRGGEPFYKARPRHRARSVFY